MLFCNQQKCQVDIENFISQENISCMIIEGERNIGKITTILDTLNKLVNMKYLLFKDYLKYNISYVPFYNAINSLNYGIKDFSIYDDQIIKDSKILPNTLGSLLKLHKLRKSNKLLNEEEQNILSFIQRAIKFKKKYIFVIDSYYNWNIKSKNLLKVLYKDSQIRNNHNLKWIFTTHSKSETIFIKENFRLFNQNAYEYSKIENMTIQDFSKCMNFFDVNLLYSDKDYDSLYKILKSDISAIKFICQNSSSNDLKDFTNSKVQLLKAVIEKKLLNLNAYGDLILDTMEYISILNSMISVDELEYILKKTESEIRSIVNEANKLYLLSFEDQCENYVDFALDIVKSIYKEIPNENFSYYSKISDALAIINPSNYEKRADLLLEIGEKTKSSVLYCLEYIRLLRENKKIDEELFKKMKIVLSENQFKFLNQLKKAIDLIKKDKYKKALEILESMLMISDKELLIERNILISLCKTKFLSTRQEAIDILSNYNSLQDVNNEIDLWERIQDRNLFANIHLGNVEKAKKIEETLLLSYSKRSTYDNNAVLGIIKLGIRSNSIYSAEVSLEKNKRAYDMYINSKNNNQNLSLYFLILTNLSAVNIMNGNYVEAFELCTKGKNLLDTEKYITFARPEILLNNFLVSGYLSGNFTKEYCIEKFENILQCIDNGAEKLLYISNYCIMLSLNSENKKAFAILYEESENQNVESSDTERLYNFRVCYNLTVFSYLSHDLEKFQNCLKKLESCLVSINDQYYDNKRKKLAMQLMNNSKSYTPEEWLYSLINNTKGYLGQAWKYYGLGYVFTASSNWNDF